MPEADIQAALRANTQASNLQLPASRDEDCQHDHAKENATPDDDGPGIDADEAHQQTLEACEDRAAGSPDQAFAIVRGKTPVGL